jgi:hypothetical protein
MKAISIDEAVEGFEIAVNDFRKKCLTAHSPLL